MRRVRSAPVILLAILAGCQSLRVPRAPDATEQQPALLAAPLVIEELPPAERKEAAPPSDAQPSPPRAAAEPLSLLDAAALALAQNPDLIAARQAEGVSLGALGVA